MFKKILIVECIALTLVFLVHRSFEFADDNDDDVESYGALDSLDDECIEHIGNRTLAATMLEVCKFCGEIYRTRSGMKNKCKSECFRNDHFKKCALLLRANVYADDLKMKVKKNAQKDS